MPFSFKSGLPFNFSPYAPDNMLENAQDVHNKNIILGSNFDVIFNPKLEKLESSAKEKALLKIIQIKKEFVFLIGIWHLKNPKTNCLTVLQTMVYLKKTKLLLLFNFPPTIC